MLIYVLQFAGTHEHVLPDLMFDPARIGDPAWAHVQSLSTIVAGALDCNPAAKHVLVTGQLAQMQGFSLRLQV